MTGLASQTSTAPLLFSCDQLSALRAPGLNATAMNCTVEVFAPGLAYESSRPFRLVPDLTATCGPSEPAEAMPVPSGPRPLKRQDRMAGVFVISCPSPRPRLHEPAPLRDLP